jgi:hypothetical protein
LAEFQRFALAAKSLREPHPESSAPDPREAALLGFEHRVTQIVLSAVDEDGLPTALAEALDYCEIGGRAGLLDIELDSLAAVRDPELPLEFRELLLTIWYGAIARLVRLALDREKQPAPAWLYEALRRHEQAFDAGMARLGSLTDEDVEEMNARWQASEERIADWSGRAAESGQEVYWPLGEVDE